MRRLLRSAFVLLVVATLLAPLPMGEVAAADVPICCLPQGDHHCMGQMLGGAGAPGVKAASKCPYAPLALAALHAPNLAPPTGTQVLAAVEQFSPLAPETSDWISFSAIDTRLVRGPPAFSLN